jgi:hypothetical protein
VCFCFKSPPFKVIHRRLFSAIGRLKDSIYRLGGYFPVPEKG